MCRNYVTSTEVHLHYELCNFVLVSLSVSPCDPRPTTPVVPTKLSTAVVSGDFLQMYFIPDGYFVERSDSTVGDIFVEFSPRKVSVL